MILTLIIDIVWCNFSSFSTNAK